MKLFELFATLTLDTKDFERKTVSSINTGKRAAGSLSSIAEKATMNINKALSSGAAVLGKAFTVGTAAVGAGFAAMTKKALDFTGELEQNLGGSEAVWGKYAEKIQTAGKNAFGMLGLSTSEYLATANKMGSLFMGAGFETEEALDLTMEAMQRAADVASIMGIDVEWAMESIAGATKGNFTMMDNLGVAINDTTLKQYALSKGITKSTQAMTTQEKVALAMELFLERTAYAAGNYARENDTLAGALGTAKAAFVNFLDGSGNIDDFVAAAVKAGRVVGKNLQEIVPRLFTSSAEAVRRFIPHVQAAWVDVWDNKLPGVITSGANAVIGLINGVFSTNIPTITKIDMPSTADIVSAFDTWWNGEDGAKQKVKDALDFSGIVATGIGEVGGNVYQWFIDNKDVVSSALGTVGTALLVFSAKATPGTTAIVALSAAFAAFSTDWDAVKTRFPEAVEQFEAFSGLDYDTVAEDIEALGKAIGSVGGALGGGFLTGLAWLNDNGIALGAGVLVIASAFGKWLLKAHPLATSIAAITTALGYFKKVGGEIINSEYKEYAAERFSDVKITDKDVENLQRYIDAERAVREAQKKIYDEPTYENVKNRDALLKTRDYYYKLVRPYENDSWNYVYRDLLASYESWLQEKKINGLTDEYGLLDVLPNLAPESKQEMESQLKALDLTAFVTLLPDVSAITDSIASGVRAIATTQRTLTNIPFLAPYDPGYVTEEDKQNGLGSGTNNGRGGGSGKTFVPVFGDFETPDGPDVKTPTDLPGQRVGLDYVPYDDFAARLHEGEAVLTKAEAARWRESSGARNADTSRLEDLLTRILGKLEGMDGMSVSMDGKTVGRIVAPTVSLEIERESRRLRFT